jgi:hypothetical protein
MTNAKEEKESIESDKKHKDSHLLGSTVLSRTVNVCLTKEGPGR